MARPFTTTRAASANGTFWVPTLPARQATAAEATYNSISPTRPRREPSVVPAPQLFSGHAYSWILIMLAPHVAFTCGAFDFAFFLLVSHPPKPFDLSLSLIRSVLGREGITRSMRLLSSSRTPGMPSREASTTSCQDHHDCNGCCCRHARHR